MSSATILDFTENQLNISKGPLMNGALRFIGVLAILGGGYALYILNYIGVIFLVIGLFMAFGQTGILVQFHSSRSKDYVSLLGLKLGSWTDLGQMKLVEVKKGTETSGGTAAGVGGGASVVVVYKVYLLNPGKKRMLLHAFPDPDSANDFGHRVADGLKVEFVGRTE